MCVCISIIYLSPSFLSLERMDLRGSLLQNTSRVIYYKNHSAPCLFHLKYLGITANYFILFNSCIVLNGSYTIIYLISLLWMDIYLVPNFLLVQIMLYKIPLCIRLCTYWQDKLLQVELPLKYCQIALLEVVPIQTLSGKFKITYYNIPFPT